MRIMQCANPVCGRPFQLNQYEFSPGFSIQWKRGEIICPHCGAVSVGDSHSVYLGHALSIAQEAEFNAGNAKSD